MTERITKLRNRALTTVAEKLTPIGSSGSVSLLDEARGLARSYAERPIEIAEGELLTGGARRLDAPAGLRPKIFDRHAWSGGGIADLPPEVGDCFTGGLLAWAGNHQTLDFDTVFAVGIEGIRGRIRSLIAVRAGEAREFLEALEIVASAYLGLCARYADLAGELSVREPDPERKAELLVMAENSRRTPALPPRTFWEACQCAWSAFLLVPDAPGRLDQYLYPFYRRDVDSGNLSRERAKELLCALWIKYFEHVGVGSGVSAHNHMTLGGVASDGTDATNDLTLLCLEVTEEIGLHRPQVGFRVSPSTPDGALRRAVRVLRSRTGNPDFCNDANIVSALVDIGVAPRDARNFSLSGCHEVIVTGMAQMGSVEGFVNMPMIVRMVLGLEPRQWNAPPLDGIRDFDGLWERVTAVMDHVAERVHRASVRRDERAARNTAGTLVASLVTGDCIQRSLGYTQGGARYNFCNWDIIGIANLADSLSAIRTLVFEERAVTLSALADILAADWSGAEELRLRAVNRVPHFGNDDPRADLPAARIIEEFSARLKRRTPFRGGEYILGTTAGGENMHVEFGRVTGATPDGRREGETFADSIGPAHGRDRSGVTAMLNSVAGLPHRLLPTATTLNVKLDPRLLEDEEGIARVAALIRGHFDSGGQQLQFNFYTREMLLEAKRRPEQNGDLMVRVAGYSAPFVSLWEDLQDEVIARTGHGI